MKNLFYRTMRITAFLLFFCSFCAFAETVSSQTAKVSIKKDKVALREVLNEIERQTDYLFVYSNDVNVKRLVSINVNHKVVAELLNKIFAEQGISYEMKGNHIVLTKRSGSDTQAVINSSTSQQGSRRIKGIVTDQNGEPIIGASILEKGTSNGTITDFNGVFELNVNADANIQISYIGYITQSLKAVTGKQMQIKLAEDSKTLDEVVVIGFGTQKKVNLTGAVSQVKMDDVLGDRPVTSLGAALQGSVPGFTASSGVKPGDGNSFQVRGLGSINSGGGSPLVLVDNVVFNDLNLINPADIESISVLKDASSAAIYGARASFGVVLITTKKGKRKEKLSINYNNNFSVSSVTNTLKLASPMDMIKTLSDGGYSSIWSGQNISEYMKLLKDYSSNPSTYPKGWTEVNGTKYFLKQNDIIGETFEHGFKQTHNLSAQGGSELINYRISLGYTDEDGILVTNKDSFRKINVSSFINGDITSWLSTSLDFKYNTGKTLYPYLASGSELGLWKTNLPSYHPIGNLPYGTDGEEYPVMTAKNIIEMTNASNTRTDDTRILSRTSLKPFKGFEAILEYSYQISSSDYSAYQNKFYMHQGLAESIKPSTSTTPYTVTKYSTKYTTLNAFATYNATIKDKHNLSLLAGFNQEYNNFRYLTVTAYNMISNELPSISGSDGSTPSTTNDSYSKYALRSGFFRANYNFMQRYFIEFNGRHDLSSKFPKNSRSGFFPSVSGAWSIGNEKFMESTKEWLSILKLRASYGTLGNQEIDNYGYFATMGIVDASWIANGKVPKTENSPNMIRANFTWEKVRTINGGLDFGFLNNRLTGSFDIYRRNTIGMLAPGEELPAVAGATAPTQNAANMKTNGWDVSLNWKDKIGEINYGLGVNLYDSRSYITKYKNETKSLSASYYEGQEIGEIWGYVTDGFYTSADFKSDGSLIDGMVKINGVTSHVGDIKFKNLMDDDKSTNIIDTGDNTATNPGDRKIIGNSRPRWQYGVNGYVGWKGMNLSFILQGVGKRDYWIGGNVIFPMSDQYATVHEHQVGKIWTEENQNNAYYGRIYENAGSSQSSNQRTSDKFLSDASYLRVKNITFSYTLPTKFINKIGLQNTKVFVSGENLFTFDHMPDGIDPENLGWTYPHYKTVSFGININL